MNRISVVAGGAGFLGSHLCDRLIERGNEVICVDNFVTGHESNIKHLIGHDRFRLYEHDINDSFYIRSDEVYNLACPASPEHYQADPIFTMRTNVIGTMNLIEMADRCDARFLQASTSEVYGDPDFFVQNESYWGNVNPIGPRACYDEGKRAAEALIFDYVRKRKTCAKVVRIFNTYGPRMAVNDGRVVSNFIVQSLRGEPITIYGDGSQTRSFCYVDDLINGILAMMDSTEAGPINLGNPEEVSIKKLAELIARWTYAKSNPVFMDLPQDDPRQRRPDIAKAEMRLGWKPSVTLGVGIEKTIDYFKGVI